MPRAGRSRRRPGDALAAARRASARRHRPGHENSFAGPCRSRRGHTAGRSRASAAHRVQGLRGARTRRRAPHRPPCRSSSRGQDRRSSNGSRRAGSSPRSRAGPRNGPGLARRGGFAGYRGAAVRDREGRGTGSRRRPRPREPDDSRHRASSGANTPPTTRTGWRREKHQGHRGSRGRGDPPEVPPPPAPHRAGRATRRPPRVRVRSRRPSARGGDRGHTRPHWRRRERRAPTRALAHHARSPCGHDGAIARPAGRSRCARVAPPWANRVLRPPQQPAKVGRQGSGSLGSRQPKIASTGPIPVSPCRARSSAVGRCPGGTTSRGGHGPSDGKD